jgi:DNA-binding NtrC family response regulator
MVQKLKHLKKISKNSILIIDDEEIIREILIEVLQIINIPSVCARTGEEGINIYTHNQNRINLILLDMVMPGMSGLETYWKLQALNPRLHIVLMSGYPNRNSPALATLPANLEFIQKPFSVQEVISKVQRLTA